MYIKSIIDLYQCFLYIIEKGRIYLPLTNPKNKIMKTQKRFNPFRKYTNNFSFFQIYFIVNNFKSLPPII